MVLLATLALVVGLGLLTRHLIGVAVRRSANETESRLRDLLAGEMGDGHLALEPLKEEKRPRASIVNGVASLISDSQLFESQEGKTFMGRLERELVLAGLSNKFTPQQALALTLVIWFVGVVFPTFVYASMGLGKALYLIMVILFLAYPFIKLRGLKNNRSDSIKGELPIFIQQLAMAVSSGQATLDDAIARTVRTAEIDPYDSILAREFGQALTEYTVGGMDRDVALRRVADRCGVVGVSNLIEAIVQGWRTGTPMDYVLETYAVKARELWRQDMRTFKARKEPIITLGLVVTMLGGFIWVGAPMLINLVSTISGI